MLRQLEKEVRGCIKCPLHMSRTVAVPGEGDSNAKLMFVGEAPGYHEDLEGRPFVGAAGKLLTKMIEQTLDIRRENVYITNIVKCRPPENRGPFQLEIKTCTPYLEKQLSIVKPQIVSSLGRYSTIYFLSKVGIVAGGILSVRGKIYEFQSDSRKLSLLPTIHPAAALYDPKNLKILENDFIKLKEMLR